MMKKYDVIVIGSGNGGLAAATKVLNAGKTCLVLEKHNIPGGFATSFVRGRFEFEASLHEFNGIGTLEQPGSCRLLFRELGVEDKIDWIHLKDAYRLITLKEGYNFAMPIGRENVIKECGKLHPDGEKCMKRFFHICDEITGALDYIAEAKGKLDPNVLMEKYPSYLTSGSYSLNEALDALDFPKIIKDNIAAYWCYLGAHADDLNFLHYANMINSYFTKGAVIPKLRSHEMSLAFETRIHELGGDIWFNSEVVKILTDENQHVCGVRLKDGKEIQANYVIANTSPHNVYGKLLDKEVVPEKARQLTNFRKLAGRGFTIFLGLNKSPEELGITDHNYFIYDSIDSVYQHEQMKNLETAGAQATVCLNIADPDCSPKGTSILYMTTLFTSDVWGNVKEEDYYKVKNQVAQLMIKRFEEATNINISDCIEEIAIATPQTYARYCGHPQGTIYGYESQYYDGLMNRIQMVEEDKFIKGLRICGGFGERLLGFPSSYKSGANEAGRILKDMMKEGN